jgi:hypothetical protein
MHGRAFQYAFVLGNFHGRCGDLPAREKETFASVVVRNRVLICAGHIFPLDSMGEQMVK